MELVAYTDSDLPLTEALECDPVVMKELGGPIAKDAIPETHRRRVDAVGAGGWWLKIVPEPSGAAAGTIGIWRSEWRGREIHEAGWMVLPSFQGRGIAGSALDRLLALARSDSPFEVVHAFPGVSNAPSNALCRRSGFTMLEECDVEYAGRILRCNHWELRLPGDGARCSSINASSGAIASAKAASILPTSPAPSAGLIRSSPWTRNAFPLSPPSGGSAWPRWDCCSRRPPTGRT